MNAASIASAPKARVSVDEDSKLIYIEDDRRFADVREKPRLDTIGTGTFASKHTFSDADFEPASFKRAVKYTADGPQNDPVIGSGSYFKDVLSLRQANTMSG